MQAPGLLILILALCCQAVIPAAPRSSLNAYSLDLTGSGYEYFLPDRLGDVRQLAGAG